MEERSLVVCWSLEKKNRNILYRNWSDRALHSCPALTSEYNFFMQVCPITVYFRNKRPDSGGPGFVLFVCLCRRRLAGQEEQHITREFRNWIIIQQEPNILSVHVFTLRLFNPAKTLVYDVRFLYPHIYSWPEAFGKSLTFSWKLNIEEFWHYWASDTTRSHVFSTWEWTSGDFYFVSWGYFTRKKTFKILTK